MRQFIFCLAAVSCFFFQTTIWAADVVEASGVDAQVIDADTWTDLATNQVKKDLIDFKETRRYTVEILKVPQPLSVSTGVLTYNVSIPNGIRYGGMTAVYIVVKLDGAPYRKVVCYVRVHVYDQVVMAAKNLLPEQILGEADLRQAECEVSTVVAKYLLSPDAVIGRVVNRRVREGTMLTESMVQNPVIMEAGVPVSIVANVNGIKIKTEGVTLQRGRADDIIRVRNTRSSKVLRARVVDTVTVEIVQ
jgi:flagellar basal body P-ring formation protein FlgA